MSAYSSSSSAILIPLLLDRQGLVLLDLAHHLGEIGHHEGGGISRRELVQPDIGEVDVAALLVHREEQQLVDFVETLLAHVVALDPLHELDDGGLIGEQLHQPLVLRRAPLRGQQLLAGLVLGVLGIQPAHRLGDQPVDRPGLFPVERAHHRGHLLERGGGVARDRPRDDERGSGLVDQNRVDLVDDCVVVRALHPLFQRMHHVVAQVVEAEFVVGAVGDVRVVRLAALRRAGVVQIDAVHGQAEKAVDRPHPFGVALGQVAVHGDQVGPAPGERVQVQGHRGDKGLPLAGGHLRHPAAVKLRGADQLHVVGDHVPNELLSRDLDLLSHQPPARLLDDGKRVGEDLLQHLRKTIAVLLFELADIEAEGLALVGVRRVVLALAKGPRSLASHSRCARRSGP